MKKLILALLCFASPAFGQASQQFPQYINGLPAATQVGANDLFYILQGGVSRSAALGSIPVAALSANGTVAPTVPAGQTVIGGLFNTPTLANIGSGLLSETNGGGIHLQGNGTVNDITIVNKNALVAMSVPTGTVNVTVGGALSSGTSPTLASASTVLSSRNTADGIVALIAGNTKAIRFNANATNMAMEGVDNTGVGSFQPMTFGGTKINFSSSTAPSLTAGCNGAGSGVGGTDVSGTALGQTAATTTCTLTFGTVFVSAPSCIVSGVTGALTSYATSTTAIVVNFASTANFRFNWFCPGI